MNRCLNIYPYPHYWLSLDPSSLFPSLSRTSESFFTHNCPLRIMLTLSASLFFLNWSAVLDISLLPLSSSLCWHLYCPSSTHVTLCLLIFLTICFTRAQNNTACIVFHKWKADHVTPFLCDLHYLPLWAHIGLKIPILYYHVVHCFTPICLCFMPCQRLRLHHS